MIVKRVAPVSFAKVAGILYAIFGLCIGALFTLAALLGAFAFGRSDAPVPGMGMLFGVGAIIILPIFYGVLGFIFSLIGAALYNAVAGWVGGVEMDLQ
jgi:hypothetical protein